jgi:hypothetical protein
MIEEAGIRVRIYERESGGSLFREVRLNGGKDRKSLKHADRELAETQARELARRLSQHVYAGTGGPVTLGVVLALYLQHRVPLLSLPRQQNARNLITLFRRLWGEDLLVDNLGQTQIDAWVDARRSGALRPKKRRGGKGVRDGTIRNDFLFLSAVFNWARGHRVNGKRLISENPLRDVKTPSEKNPQRPVASHDRYERTQEYTNVVDPQGRLRCMLALARYTGRRETAICELRACDVLRSREAILRVLAETGGDERLADHMPFGGIRWRAEFDKMGYDAVAPLNRPAREALDEYLQANPRVGEVPLFPAPRNDAVAISKNQGCRWLIRAERMAGLQKFFRGTWHPYRRLWASERKHLPDVDVAAAGGWRDTRALKRHYQQPDAATIMRVVNAAT